MYTYLRTPPIGSAWWIGSLRLPLRPLESLLARGSRLRMVVRFAVECTDKAANIVTRLRSLKVTGCGMLLAEGCKT